MSFPNCQISRKTKVRGPGGAPHREASPGQCVWALRGYLNRHGWRGKLASSRPGRTTTSVAGTKSSAEASLPQTAAAPTRVLTSRSLLGKMGLHGVRDSPCELGNRTGYPIFLILQFSTLSLNSWQLPQLLNCMCMCERYFKLSSECFQLIINMLKSFSRGLSPPPPLTLRRQLGPLDPTL